MNDELGAGPLAIARAQRARVARVLLETSDLDITAVAHASGFGSVRQFNDTVREVFGCTPSDLRRRAGARSTRAIGTAAGAAVTSTLRLAVRAPFAGREVLAHLAARAVRGVEAVDDDGALVRSLRLPHGHGIVRLSLDGVSDRPVVIADVTVADSRDLAPAVARCRHLLDLDADPHAVDASLARDPLLAPLVHATPGRRVPGTVDPTEVLLRAIVGQQVSVAGARTTIGRIVALVDDRVDADVLAAAHPAARGTVSHLVPSAEQLAALDPADLPMPRARAAALVAAFAAVAAGEVPLHIGADRDELRAALVRLRGIGEWTADYVVMRSLGDPDVLLPTDLGVRRAFEAAGLDGSPRAVAERAAAWVPWRSYAMHHLWAAPTPDTRREP
jgi:AraC family transcriptional regulator of adaptative response / DNA-3-methyladenine glycosylase II